MLFNNDILTIRKKIWDEWDPINLQYFVTDLKQVDDEYDTYAVEIYGLLKNKCSERELFNYLWRLETKHMCLDGDKEKTKKFAHSLLTD
jgi:hypothetical protein